MTAKADILKLIEYAKLRLIQHVNIRSLLNLDYYPHQKQASEAILLGATRLSLMWGRRSGKTTFAAFELTTDMSYGRVGRMPKRELWITAPTYEITDPVFEYCWHWIVDKKCLGYEPKIKRASDRTIEMPWGAYLKCKTSDNPDALQGKGVAMVVNDECADDAENRLVQYYEPPTAGARETGNGIIIRITTPAGRKNHASMTHLDWQTQSLTNKQYYASHNTSYSNPDPAIHAWADEYKQFCERTGQIELYNQEVLAQMITFMGAIYPQFNEAVHVQPVEYDPALPLVCGIDVGYDHPYAVIVAQVADNGLNVLNEVSMRGLNPVEQMNAMITACAEVTGKAERLQSDIDWIFIDPSAASFKELLSSEGYPVYWDSKVSGGQKLNSVLDGITIVRKLLAENRLRIHPRCVSLIDEFSGYHWSKSGLDKPEKIDDDSLDALRYLCVGMFGSEPITLEMVTLNV